ncbi:hypothetical protein M0802_007084 [Mischocyttarus mexicanus]|nr:hypothetical protein M0802_007084 [Mischocyttarus mexicanus]
MGTSVSKGNKGKGMRDVEETEGRGRNLSEWHQSVGLMRITLTVEEADEEEEEEEELTSKNMNILFFLFSIELRLQEYSRIIKFHLRDTSKTTYH